MFNANVARSAGSAKLENGRTVTNLVFGDKLVSGVAQNDKGGTSVYRWCAKTGIAVDGDHTAALVTSSSLSPVKVEYANRYRNGLGSKRFADAHAAAAKAGENALEVVKIETFSDGSIQASWALDLE